MATVVEQMWTIGDVARRLCVSPKTVSRMVDRGDLPAVRLTGGTVRFLARDVEALIESRRTKES